MAQSSDDLAKAGEHRVSAPIVCVTTRLRVKNPDDLTSVRRDYERVMSQAQSTSGLLASAFLVENARTCFMLSIWRSAESIPRFGTDAPEHVWAVRRAFEGATVDEAGNPEVWSAKWDLRAVSSNLNWDGLDLRGQLINPDKDDGGRKP